MSFSESELYSIKWYDYRMLRPHACDLMFIKSYVEECIVHNDIMGTSKYLNPISKLDLGNYNKWRNRNFITRLRRIADTLSMPYDVFWQLAFKTMRNMNFKYTYLNSYVNKAIIDNITSEWRELESCFIIKSSNKIFDVEQYKILDIQEKYYDYLLRKIVMKYGTGGSPLIERLRKMVENKEIPKEFVLKNLVRIVGELNGTNG